MISYLTLLDTITNPEKKNTFLARGTRVKVQEVISIQAIYFSQPAKDEARMYSREVMLLHLR